jgi:regulatory protein
VEHRRPPRAPKPPPNGIEKALSLLGRRQRTARELDQALARVKVPADERAAAVARMRELGYIDDPATAAARAKRFIGRGESPLRVQQRLRSQGVTGQDAKAAATEAAAGQTPEALARQALEQRLRGRQVKDQKDRERLLRWLVSKGHRPSAAAQAVKLAWDGSDGDGDSDGTDGSGDEPS